jgi:hypothetical protein
VNYVLDVKKSAIERLHLSFERFADDLGGGLQPASASDTEHSLLIDEVKVGCSLAMLQCLDRPHRAAYVLGEVMELSGPEAAEVLAISPELFRKRLQLAREAVLGFLRSHCGLVSDSAPCVCHLRVGESSPRQNVRCGLPGGRPPSRRRGRWSAKWTRRWAQESTAPAAARLVDRLRPTALTPDRRRRRCECLASSATPLHKSRPVVPLSDVDDRGLGTSGGIAFIQSRPASRRARSADRNANLRGAFRR